MSGGVDSAVAAARAVDAGHDVVGVHLALSETPAALRGGSRGCCSREDADARRAADVLDIPFYVWDFAARFGRGRRRLRRRVRERADAQPVRPLQREDQVRGAARPGARPGLRRGLHRALRPAVRRGAAPRVDAGKDQSYVLAVLTAAQLRHAMFPLGDTPKPQMRAEAAAIAGCGWPTSRTATTSASSRRRHPRLPRRAARCAPGAVVDAGSGQVLARHDGVHGFTVGQRRGSAWDNRPRTGGLVTCWASSR